MPEQDQTNQQGVSSIARSMLVESILHSLPKPSDSSNDRWTNESMAELEKELVLAYKKQKVDSLLASIPLFPSSCSVEEL
jgi:hypothetical protein